MVQALRMPMMGNTMETGLLAGWRAEEGAEVAEDEVVAVVESEKAAADVVADRDGVLARVDVAAGEEVPPGTLIGVVVGPGESVDEAPPPRSRIEPGGSDGTDEPADADATGTTDRTAPDRERGSGAETGSVEGSEPAADRIRVAPGARRLAAEEGVDLGGVDGTGPDGAVLIADVEEHLDASGGAERPTTRERSFANPTTRRLARRLGVPLDAVTGTGVGGRVTASDVRAAAGAVERPARTGTGARESTDVSGPPPRDPASFGVTVAEERDLSGVRRTVAERMTRSARAPHVTLNREVDVTRAFETADELRGAGDSEVGFTDLLLAAAVRALETHPEFNAWYEGETLRLVEEANVAVAVDADVGLVTPVVRDAGERSLEGIARERRRLTDAVLDGAHSMDDLQGGTFTVTNLGPFGVGSFDPIVDPPQVAILGVGSVEAGSCTLSLTFDHRVVDGADAARFLDTLVGGLEAPSVLVAERAAAGGGGGGTGGRTAERGESRDERAGSSGPSASADAGPESVAAAVARDVEAHAREVAAHHGWPVPSFEVELDGDRPTVAVRGPESASPATLRRLAYAACRESRFADTVAGLRDPEVTVAAA